MNGPMSRAEARVWLENATDQLTNGTTDSITPLLAMVGIGYALLDVADAIREQAAAEHSRWMQS